MNKVNVFEKDIGFEKKVNPFHFKYLKKILGGIVVDVDKMPNEAAKERFQKMGVDVLLVVNGEPYVVDKKTRRYSQIEHYGKDILIEEISNDKTGKQGWIFNETVDILSYGFVNKDKTDLIAPPFVYWFKPLREWFLQNKEKYPLIPAQNRGYKTWSRPIPCADIEQFRVNPQVNELIQVNLKEFLEV